MKKENISIIVKIAIAILLSLCLLKMPYGYYQLTRLICCFWFGMMAYNYLKYNNEMIGFGLTIIALLFNPIFKVHFEKSIWNVIDIAIASILFAWATIDIVYLYNGKSKKEIKA